LHSDFIGFISLWFHCICIFVVGLRVCGCVCCGHPPAAPARFTPSAFIYLFCLFYFFFWSLARGGGSPGDARTAALAAGPTAASSNAAAAAAKIDRPPPDPCCSCSSPDHHDPLILSSSPVLGLPLFLSFSVFQFVYMGALSFRSIVDGSSLQSL